MFLDKVIGSIMSDKTSEETLRDQKKGIIRWKLDCKWSKMLTVIWDLCFVKFSLFSPRTKTQKSGTAGTGYIGVSERSFHQNSILTFKVMFSGLIKKKN